MKLHDGRVVQIEPDWFGKLSGITLLFEALVLARYPACSFCEAGSTDTPSGEITSNTVPPKSKYTRSTSTPRSASSVGVAILTP